MTLAVASNQASAEESRRQPAESATSSRVAYFEYVGSRARVVTGGSGQKYHLAARRSMIAVDSRDWRAVAQVPGLRQVG